VLALVFMLADASVIAVEGGRPRCAVGTSEACSVARQIPRLFPGAYQGQTTVSSVSSTTP
jgi:hypothetical protein